ASGSTVPADAIDVRAAPYNAQGDGCENWGLVTTSGGTLTLTNFSGAITLSTVNATTALLTIDGARWSGWAFQPSHVGSLLYLSVSGYTLSATVQKYLDGQNVWLNAASITPQSGVTGTVTLPAFASLTDTGKAIVVEGMGQEQWWQSGFTVKMTDTVTPYGRLSWGNAIATVVAPNQITISGLFPFTWTNVSTRVLWGTNDVNALSLAATAAIAANKRKIWLGGDGRLYLALGVVSSSAWRFAYFPQVSTEPGPL